MVFINNSRIKREKIMNMKFVIIAVAVIGFVALMIWGVEATMCKEALNCVK